jgi:hypothetical protein
MSLKIILKYTSFILLALYLIANQMFSFNQETKLFILPILIIASVITFIARIKIGASFKKSQIIALSLSLLATFIILIYFIKTPF